MCGRFTNKAKPEEIKKEFNVARIDDSVEFEPRYNIAPSQMISAVVEREGEERIVAPFKWGLVPSWAKDAEIGNRMINARAESLTEKPSFREAFRRRRCIIPTTGFFEWQRKSSGAKQPFYFYLKNREVFGFAGLWEEWLDKDSGELLETCTIITTEANKVLEPVHDRMPVILKAENYNQWLNAKERNVEELQRFLSPYPSSEMDSHSVSRAVNSPTSDSPNLILNSK